MKRQITINQFNPYVRNILKVNRAHFYPELYMAYDHRLFYVSKGSMEIEFEQEVVTLQKGTVILIPPKVLYRLLFFENKPFEYYVFNFDFDSRYIMTAPRTPETPDKYDYKKIFSESVIVPFQQVFILQGAESLAVPISELLQEYMVMDEESASMTSALMKCLLIQIIRMDKRKNINTKSSMLIHEVKEYMKQHITEQMLNASLGKKFGYHPYYLNDLFVKSEGVSLHKYILDMRMANAKELLISTNKSVTQIAEECGFSGVSYFCEYFKKNYGITPSKYRETGR